MQTALQGSLRLGDQLACRDHCQQHCYHQQGNKLACHDHRHQHHLAIISVSVSTANEPLQKVQSMQQKIEFALWIARNEEMQLRIYPWQTTTDWSPF